MPFKSLKQELYLKKNQTQLWKKWVAKYGHAAGYHDAIRKAAKKAAATRKRRNKR